MLSFLPSPLKGALAGLLFIFNTVLWCSLIYVFVILKFMIPLTRARAFFTRIMVAIAENWISCNDFNMRLTQEIHWDIQGLEHLDRNKSYLVCANHQSWVDIVALQHVFNRRIPFLRFFLKSQLLYVPFLGGAWWALDFPFMKRYSKSYLKKHPEKKGQDFATTRKACERFRHSRISILNFLEGTRFNEAKRDRQSSPYQNLLFPKAGGVAFVLDAMGDQFAALLDVTLVYPEGPATLWQMLSGRLHQVIVRVQTIAIPETLLKGNYSEDANFRIEMQAWVRQIWDDKDQLISRLKAQQSGPHSPTPAHA